MHDDNIIYICNWFSTMSFVLFFFFFFLFLSETAVATCNVYGERAHRSDSCSPVGCTIRLSRSWWLMIVRGSCCCALTPRLSFPSFPSSFFRFPDNFSATYRVDIRCWNFSFKSLRKIMEIGHRAKVRDEWRSIEGLEAKKETSITHFSTVKLTTG